MKPPFPSPPNESDCQTGALTPFASPPRGGFRYIAGVGHFDDGRLAEIFLNADKIGTAIETAARDSAVVASLALQHGVPQETIRRALTRNGNGEAGGPLGTLLDLLAAEREP